MEQQKIIFNYDDKITKICELKKQKTPLISNVEIDEFTQKAQENFDYDFNGINKFYPYEIPEILSKLDFQILVITGASESGKSTFSKYFGEEQNIIWNNKKAIISNFEEPNSAVEKLCAVGLNSIKTWCKPRNVLSVGEGFRADLAKRIKSNCVIDEFTSTVDRNVALSCSKSISKYIRNKKLQKCVFVSCHKDFIDCLCPDYVIDLDDECIYDTKELPRRKFDIQIFERNDKSEIWKIFGKHHYLSAELNTACKMFCAYFNDELIGMCAILPLPGIKNVEGAYRIHRLVILPDYQGLGLGVKLLNCVCNILKYNNKTCYIRTSHIKLINALKNQKQNWFSDYKMKYSTKEKGKLKNRKIYTNRKSCSFKYIGEMNKNENIDFNKIIFNSIEKKKENLNEFNLFDIIGE